MDETQPQREAEAYAERMLNDAVPWPTDRRVLLAPMEDGNVRVEVEAAVILGDPASGNCVVQLEGEQGRWYCGGDNGDHLLIWNWEETQEAAWEDLY